MVQHLWGLFVVSCHWHFEERAGLMAAFVESYLAFSIPAILAGYFVGKIGLMSTANSYIGFIILLSLVALLMIIKILK